MCCKKDSIVFTALLSNRIIRFKDDGVMLSLGLCRLQNFRSASIDLTPCTQSKVLSMASIRGHSKLVYLIHIFLQRLYTTFIKYHAEPQSCGICIEYNSELSISMSSPTFQQNLPKDSILSIKYSIVHPSMFGKPLYVGYACRHW